MCRSSVRLTWIWMAALSLLIVPACNPSCPDPLVDWNRLQITWGDEVTMPSELLPDGDQIAVTIEPIAQNDRVEIVFQTAPNVTWWKQIEVFDANCRVRTGSQLELQDANHGPTQAFIIMASELSSSTIHLSKAKFLGIHTGMYRLPPIPTGWLGQRLLFTWIRD